MREDGGNPPGHDASKSGNGGIRTPIKGESSSPNTRIPSDAETLFGAPPVDSKDFSPTVFPSDSPTVVGSSFSLGSAGFTPTGQSSLVAGHLLAQRYEVLSQLGEGGMGAVYKARDVELGRLVALKVIRPDLARNRAILDRFKQELILATQVTHRNVVRIYDLGEADGIKFITMEYVEGEDLASVLHKRTKLPAKEAVGIIEQVCRALEAAHNVGVIHRDLKPQNIMEDKSGRILVMDFGLAKTLEGERMTQTGAMVGTMEYMSPEQALAGNLDQRSDIFSLGLIFYELLTGATPFRADSALASLIKRTQERVVPVSELDSSIPSELSQIVGRCLERDVALRYQSASELLGDLELWQGTGKSGVIAARLRPGPKRWATENKPLLAGAIGVLLFLVAVLAYFLSRPKAVAPPETKQAVEAARPRSLAILPFRNSSGDPKDDWIGSSVADMLSTDIGQSAHLHTVSTDRLHQVLSDLHVGPETAIDPDVLRRVAQFSNADVLVSGQYAIFGDQVVIDATIRDLIHDQTVPVKARALLKDLPAAIDSLSDSVRKNLSFSADVVEELKAQSFKPISTSVDALKEFNQGSVLMRAGKNLEALKHLQAATDLDANFALAFSGLADVQAELGFQADAEQSSIRAMNLAQNQNLPLPEKYLINAGNAHIMKDNKKAMEAYANLSRSLPGDVDVQYKLGVLYLQNGEYDKARDTFANLLKNDPKNIKALWQTGVVGTITGNPQAALDALTQGLTLSIQLDNQEQRALILLDMGIAYRELNKPEEAVQNYQESIAINEKIGQKWGLSAGFNQMANLEASSGKPDAALASYNKSLTLLREIGMKPDIAHTLMNMGTVYQDLGRFDQALGVFKQALQIQRETGDQGWEAQCLHNIAEVYLTMGDSDNAFTYYEQALQMREKLGVPGDIAETLEGLSLAYTTNGQYEQAMTALMRALELARKAGDQHRVALVLHRIALVFQYQGRFGAAVKSMQDAVNSFRQQGEKGLNMAEFFIDLAGALCRDGQFSEAVAPLEEAQKIQQALKNDALQSALLNARGDLAFYQGDLKNAAQFYQSSLGLASHTKDGEELLSAKVGGFSIAVAQGRYQETLRGIETQLDSKASIPAHMALQMHLDLARAAIGLKDYVRANHALEQELPGAQRAGVRYGLATIYYLLGTSARLSGSAERAGDYYRESAQLLEGIRSDSGAQNIMRRPDFKAMYDESNRWKR